MINPTTTSADPLVVDDPLSTAAVRYQLRITSFRADQPASGPARPFGLRAAQLVPTPVSPVVRYCPRRQLAVDADGVALIETMGKELKTKSSTN